ncbi:ATP-binding protein [Spirochaetia bacterium 38H-sp]|uniref:ATP-binding protein n=1 Tax=Rarispira pelagica TaxID=3141764 RepID=A0ABU9UBE7_9SPIR
MNSSNFGEIENLFKYNNPRWLKYTLRKLGQGISRYNMIEDGDRIVLGISGGKDSLALALLLSLRRKWLPIDYELRAVQIEWQEFPMTDEQVSLIKSFFNIIDVPYVRLTETMFPGSYKDDFNCYRCARNRKRILFDYMAKEGFSKLALGHHLDDIVTTTIINMTMRGKLFTMMPIQEFFKGKLHIIRPMCEIRESAIITIKERLNLPVVKAACPYKDTNLRLSIQPVMENLFSLDPHAREKIYRSLIEIKPDYLPYSLKT